MGHDLFTYGSLVVPHVMQAVTGQLLKSAPACLHGYDRFMLKGRVYPAIVKASGCVVQGRVYFDLDDDALSRLDHFESDDYHRLLLETELDEQRRVAFVYVIPDQLRHLLSDERWDETRFVREELDAYLKLTAGWMADYATPEQ